MEIIYLYTNIEYAFVARRKKYIVIKLNKYNEYLICDKTYSSIFRGVGEFNTIDIDEADYCKQLLHKYLQDEADGSPTHL